MVLDPGPNFVTDVPGSVIPTEKQGPLPLVLEISQQPSQESTGNGTNGATGNKADQHLIETRQIQAITSDGFAIRICSRHLVLVLMQRLILSPAMESRLFFAAPPDFIFKTKDEVWLVFRPPDQPVPLLFFNA